MYGQQYFQQVAFQLKEINLNFFSKNIKHDKFKNLEIDARIIIFFTFYYNQYNVLLKKLTYYNFDLNGITAKNFQIFKILVAKEI